MDITQLAILGIVALGGIYYYRSNTWVMKPAKVVTVIDSPSISNNRLEQRTALIARARKGDPVAYKTLKDTIPPYLLPNLKINA
jgi:hypothetical protein